MRAARRAPAGRDAPEPIRALEVTTDVTPLLSDGRTGLGITNGVAAAGRLATASLRPIIGSCAVSHARRLTLWARCAQGGDMDVTAVVIELKPNTGQRVEEWAAHIREHRDEALETLRAEGVSVESWFSLSLGGKEYLLAYMRSESMEASAAVARRSAAPIDAYHRKFKEDTWLRGTDARLLVDLAVDVG